MHDNLPLFLLRALVLRQDVGYIADTGLGRVWRYLCAVFVHGDNGGRSGGQTGQSNTAGIDCFHRHRELFVVESAANPRLIGEVFKDDLMDAYHHEMVKRESGEVFAYNLNRPRRMEKVEVMDGYGIIELEVPHTFVGKRLRDLAIRNRFGVTVLAVKRTAGEGAGTCLWVPESGDSIEEGDMLVLMGEHQKIEEFRSRF